MPVFEVLEQHDLEVFLVNARHTKNVPGRKSDIQECQWLLIKAYIENQRWDEDDESFKITAPSKP